MAGPSAWLPAERAPAFHRCAGWDVALETDFVAVRGQARYRDADLSEDGYGLQKIDSPVQSGIQFSSSVNGNDETICLFMHSYESFTLLRLSLPCRFGHPLIGENSTDFFDYLVAASGVRPRPLTWERNVGRVFRVRMLTDAERLREAIRPGSRVVVIGGGFIGGEVSASARALGAEVTLLCPSVQLLRPALGSVLAQKIMERHEEAGVDVRVNERLPEVNADAARIELASGEIIEADVVVEAVGSLPNYEWLDSELLDLTDGVLCGNSLRAAGSENVYAIGDLARFPNPMFDDVPRRIEHWNIAVETGRLAAQSIPQVSGTQPSESVTDFTPLPSFWSNQYEYRIQAYGLPRIADRIESLEGEMRSAPIMGYYRGDQLVAVVGLDNGPQLIEYSREVGSRPPQ